MEIEDLQLSDEKSMPFSSEIIPASQQKLTFGFSLSEMALPFPEMQLVESQGAGLNNTDCDTKHPSRRTTSSLALFSTYLVKPTVSGCSFHHLREPTSPKGFVFIFRRAETDGRGKTGRIFPAP